MSKVLLVDDSRFWRTILEDLLKKNGYEVLVAENALQGVEVALKKYPDIIITDYNMPGISGLQMCLYLRSVPAFKNAGIVILTGSDDIINEFWAFHSGANKFISKMLPKEQLEYELLRFIHGDYKTDSSLTHYASNIYDVLEQKMRTEILNREILSLIQFARDEFYVINNLKKFLENFSNFGALAFMLLSPVEGRVYNFGFHVQKESLKNGIISVMERPVEPSTWSFFGEYGDDSALEEFIFFVVKYDSSEICVIAFSRASDPRGAYNVFIEAEESLGLLFNTLNLFRELKVASSIDNLTGLFNKKEILKFLDETHNSLSEAVAEPIDDGKVYYVAMLDIDDFKRVNDTYGHLVGDEVLREIGRILRKSIGENTMVGRYGGEEFTIVFTNTDEREVISTIDNILDQVRKTQFPSGKCTISCGVASSKNYHSPTETLKAADKLLYLAKKSGKDKAVYEFLQSDELLSDENVS
ncbi:MAG: diguanylate cyclase [Fervidobacterium sp.]|nr:diguanylate cyclase [Fervidobacterium sp.]MBP9517963.1 diguanylate cyclase [Fervidobacterium sp.]